MLGAKVAPRTFDRLEKYADKEGISKSEAADRMIKQGLDVEESNMRLVPVRSDGGTVIEDRLDELEASQASSLEDTQGQVNRLSEEIEELTRFSQEMGPVLVVAFMWIAIVSSVSLPTIVVIVTGLLLSGGLTIQWARWVL